MNALVVVVSLLATIFTLLYYVSKRKFNYWKNKNVPHLKPLAIFGNYRDYILQKEYPGIMLQKLCQQFPEHPYFGAYFGPEPVLVVQSPDVVRDVLTKDFYYFNGREITNHTQKEILTKSLFFTGGDNWKVYRQNLTPLFTSSKMKNMFYLIEKCVYTFEDLVDYEVGMSDVIEVRDMCSRFTMDCICTCAFGVESNVMGKDPNNPFRVMADEIFLPTNYKGMKIITRSLLPLIFYGLGMKTVPFKLEKFFLQLLKDVFQSRNYKPSKRQDFVDLVLGFKNEEILIGDSLGNAKTGKNDKIQVKVDDELLVSQCIMFFAGGFETSATTMSLTLYELAKNQDAQTKAIQEADEYLQRHGNKFSYDTVPELTFLDACVQETLRVYPVIGVLTREVMDEYEFSTGLRVDKGVRVHVPVYHFHHNPDYFPEPEKYKPERFLPENKKDLKPYTYFPFGEGPRLCLGKRFSKMQVLPGIVTILKKYRVELAEGMPENLELESRSFLVQPREQGLNLKFIKREGYENRRLIRA